MWPEGTKFEREVSRFACVLVAVLEEIQDAIPPRQPLRRNREVWEWVRQREKLPAEDLAARLGVTPEVVVCDLRVIAGVLKHDLADRPVRPMLAAAFAVDSVGWFAWDDLSWSGDLDSGQVGRGVLRTLRMLCSEATMETVFAPTLSDMISEHSDAVTAGKVWTARTALARGYWALTASAVLHVGGLAFESLRRAIASEH